MTMTKHKQSRRGRRPFPPTQGSGLDVAAVTPTVAPQPAPPSPNPATERTVVPDAGPDFPKPQIGDPVVPLSHPSSAGGHVLVADDPNLDFRVEQTAAEASSGPIGPRIDRKPFGTQTPKLPSRPRPGYVQRIFNDEPGRIDRAKVAGYTMVLGTDGKPITHIVDKRYDGGGLVGYLMEIPEQFYNEDFAAKMEALDETDRAIYGGHLNERPGDERYVPKDTIKMTVQRGGSMQRIKLD